MIDNVEWIKQLYEQNIRYELLSDFNGVLDPNLELSGY